MNGDVHIGVLTSRGRITLPKQIRVRLGLKERDEIEFVAEAERTWVRRARRGTNPFAQYIGILGGLPRSKKAIRDWVGELRKE